jgi:c(7)-type cytochrome triheme protein
VTRGSLVLIGAAAVLCGLAVTASAAPARPAPTPAPANAPPDFVIPKSESSPGEVRFSHRLHLVSGVHCSTCHMRDMKMKRGETKITLEGKQAGRFCGVCHDGKSSVGGRPVFPIDECDRCHR